MLGGFMIMDYIFSFIGCHVVHSFYSGCQKNLPIAGRFFCDNAYTATLFTEHYDDKRYNMKKGDTFRVSPF
jgi:hypothetical protein